MQRGSGHHERVAGCADDEREQRCDDPFPDECRACSHPLLLSNGGLPPSGRSTDLPYSIEGPSFTCKIKKSRIAAALVGRAANRTPSGDGSSRTNRRYLLVIAAGGTDAVRGRLDNIVGALMRADIHVGIKNPPCLH